MVDLFFSLIFEGYREEIWEEHGAGVYFDGSLQIAGDVTAGKPEVFGIVGICEHHGPYLSG